jgi:hypothetical protein
MRAPPHNADEMRRLVFRNREEDLPPHRPAIWLNNFDGRVMLCEPFMGGNCGADVTFFGLDESGAVAISNSGLVLECVSAR